MIIKDSISSLAIFFVCLVFTFYSLGRILQSWFHFKKTKIAVAIPIGFIAYLLITQIFYTPFILINAGQKALEVSEIIKTIFLFLIIFTYYKAWIPYKMFTAWELKSHLISFLSFSGIIVIFWFVINSQEWFNNSNTNSPFFIGINNLITKKSANFSTGNNEIISAHQIFETTYYWIANISLATKVSLKSILNMFIPFIIIIVTATATESMILDSNNSLISHGISFIFNLLILFVLGYVGSYNEIFIAIPVALFALLLGVNFSKDAVPNNKIIYIALISLISMTSLTMWSMLLIIIFGTAIIFLSLQKDEINFIKNTLFYLTLLIITLVIFELLNYLQNKSIGWILLRFGVVTFISLLFLFPIYSLAFISDRKEDQAKTVTHIKKHLFLYVIILSIFLMVISGLLTGTKIISGGPKLIVFFNVITDKLWLSILLWLFGIIIPSILIFITKNKFDNISFLLMAAFINLVFMNPITLLVLLDAFGLDINIFTIFTPSISLIVVWGVSLILRYI